MANLGNTKVNGSLQADEVKVIGEAGKNALFVSGNATVTGDLEVQGDLVYVGTQNIRVEDKVIEIAYKSGSATTAAEADGAGFVIGNEANPVASIKYRHSDEKIVFDKHIAATVDSADVATRAVSADKTKAAITFGTGFKNSGVSFNGSDALTVEVDAEAVKMKSAEHADSASKVDHALTIKGDGVVETVFDGSEAKEVNIDLKNYQKVADFNTYTASAALEHANILASASKYESASAAALKDYSVSQSAVNTGLRTDVDANKEAIQSVKDSYVTNTIFNAHTQSVNQSITDINNKIGTESVASQITTAVENLTVASTGSAGYHIVSVAQNNGSISATVAKDDEYTIIKQAEAEAGFLATYQLTKNGVGVGAKINLAKDLVVESGDVKTVTENDKPVAGYKVGDKYIDLVLANSNNHIYILVSDLVDKFDGKNLVLSSAYVKASTYTDPAVGDKIDTAVGKLAKGIEVSIAKASQALADAKTYSKNAVDWVAANGTNVEASASVASEAKAEAGRLTAKSGSWDTAASIVETNKAGWSAAETNAIKSASASLAAYSASQATENSSLDGKITDVSTNASNWHNADSAAAAAAQKKADEAYASALAWHTADSAAAAEALTSASALDTRLNEVEAATGSYMQADASNSNVGASGIKFAGNAVIKFNATEQAFEFIFN